MGRRVRKDELADASMFLLSDFGGYVMGAELSLDGGRRG
ncbi:hypothetical protein [Arthrobacter sp. cf158]